VTVIDTLKSVVERVPMLQKPAYAAFTAALKIKYASLGAVYRTTGLLPHRLSDRGQDRWVIDEVFRGKENGFFVELGAADGFCDSNTFVLEKQFGWQGLCIEPNPKLFARMTSHYKRKCTCVPLAVDAESGMREFLLDGQRSGLLVAEADFSSHQRASAVKAARREGRAELVETLSLAAIFDRYAAPPTIDYFSFDVEGAETRILRNFPFDRYKFLALTIERPTAELNHLLFQNGYHFVRNSLYDSFYIHRDLPNFGEIKRRPFEQLPPKLF